MSVCTRIGFFALVGICQLLAASPIEAKARLELRRPERRTITRLDEMVEWLAREQYSDGGFTWRNRVAFSAGSVQYRLPDPPPSEVVDTAIVGLALLRTDAATRAQRERDILAACIAYVEQATQLSDEFVLELGPQKSPLMIRVGRHADTFFALWLLAETHDPGSPGQPDPLVTKLIAKVEKNIRADGSWGNVDAALNAPLLGHAVGVRALETAARRGFKVNPDIVAKAEQYAVSEAAQRLDESMNGRWKPDCGEFRPKWMSEVDLDDFEPINEAFYLSAARLSVLDQADRSNLLMETKIRERLTKPADNATLAKIAASLRSIIETRRTLARARGQMLAAMDKKKSFAPELFSAEDFLAALLAVDAMSVARLDEWFPPTVRGLLQYQDVDGGLKIQDHISCNVDPSATCECDKRINRERGMPRELCPMQKSFCARDRILCTAAGYAILLADTPYRAEFLNPPLIPGIEPPIQKKRSVTSIFSNR